MYRWVINNIVHITQTKNLKTEVRSEAQAMHVKQKLFLVAICLNTISFNPFTTFLLKLTQNGVACSAAAAADSIWW